MAADDTYAGIASADYIVEIYVDAHDKVLEHERTGSEVAIRRAAAALCHGLTRLSDDDRFWGSLADIRTSAHAKAAETPLGDLDSLLGLERDVLEKVGVPSDAAAKIVQEVARELESFYDYPNEWSVSRLREAVDMNGQFACLSASPLAPDQRSVVETAGIVAAGAVVIVADAIAAVPGITDLSVVVGGRIIGRYAFPDPPRN